VVIKGGAFRHGADLTIWEDLQIPMSRDTQQQDVAMDGLCPLKGLSVAGA
jgi:hypothetical protein